MFVYVKGMAAVAQKMLGRKITILAKVNGVTVRGLVDTKNRGTLVGLHLVTKEASMGKEPLTSVFGQTQMATLVKVRIQDSLSWKCKLLDCGCSHPNQDSAFV